MAKVGCIKPGSELDKKKSLYKARFMSEGMGAAEADSQAENIAVASSKASRAKKVANLLMDAKKFKELSEAMKGKTGSELADYFNSLSTRNEYGKHNDVIPVTARQAFYKVMADDLKKDLEIAFYRLKRPEYEVMNDAVKKELGGIDTGNQVAKKAAEGARSAMNAMHYYANKLGMDIGTLTDYYYPQKWIPEKVSKEGNGALMREMLLEAYSKPGEMVPLLGRDGMPLVPGMAEVLDSEGNVIRGENLEDVINSMVDKIQSGDVYGTDVGAFDSSVGSQHSKPRYIQFKNHETRMKFEKLFGEEDVVASINSYLFGMSRSLGLMETFGTNPDRMFGKLYSDVVRPLSSGLDNKQRIKIERYYKAIAGHYDRVADPVLAAWSQRLRDTLSSVQLTTSILAQINDLLPYSLVSAANEIPLTKALTKFFKGFGTKVTEEDIRILRSAYMESDGVNAYLADTVGSESKNLPAKLRDMVYTYGLVRKWTETTKHSTQFNLLEKLAEISEMDFQSADSAIGNKLSQYGMTPEEWDMIRSAPKMDVDGVKFVSASNIAEHHGPQSLDAIKRLTYYLGSETNLVTSEATAIDRAFLQGYHQKGTFGQTVASSASQYKGFVVRFTKNQIGEFMRQADPKDRAAFGARFLFGMLTLGMISYQSKRIIKGQGMADMSNPNTWIAAFLQSGGLGIFGDFAVAGFGENRYGHTFLTTLAGPTAGAIDDVVKLTAGNIGQAARGEKANFASEAVKFAGRYTPLAHLPVLGLAYDRLFIDQIRIMADPTGTRRSFMSEETRDKNTYGSQAWWKRGQTLPEFLK